jgi:hypothetical protein
VEAASGLNDGLGTDGARGAHTALKRRSKRTNSQRECAENEMTTGVDKR